MSLMRSITLPKQSAKSTRDSNIELLRILTMCGVVLLHYNGYQGQALVSPGTWNQVILLSGEGLFICAVNLFVLITGYFSCTSQRRDPMKVIGLFLQVVVFNCAYYLYQAIPQNIVTIRGVICSLLPANYFVVLYAVVYVISPYINLVLQKLNRKQLNKLLILSVLLFSVWPTLADMVESLTGSQIMGINPVSAYGDDWSYTFVNFALMYLVGAYIRLADIRVRKRYAAVAVAVYTAILAVTGKYDPGTGIAWSYCNPLVIGQAVAVFLLFRGIPLRSRGINELSKGAFTCFLIHTYLLSHFRVWEAVQKSPFYLLGHILFTCLSIYLVSWLAYKAYDFVTRPVLWFVNKLCRRIKLDFSVDEISSV